jgi:PEGA domain
MGVKRRSAVWLLPLVASLVPPAAAAAPRRIAVLNAATDGDAGARAAAELRRALLRESPDLLPLEAGVLSRALEEELPPESEIDAAVRQAHAQLDTARNAIAHFEHAAARRALARAETLVLALEPDEHVVQILSEVSFQAGLIHLRDQNRGLAVDAFRQVLRLVPEREPLDPTRYPPEVVQAFAAAHRPGGDAGALDVEATVDGAAVYVDGVRIGVTPIRAEIAAGLHYMVVEAPGFQSRGRKLEVAPRERIELKIELSRLQLDQRAADLRRRLTEGRGSRHSTLRRAGREVALLAGVDAVLVVGDGKGRPSVAIYERNADRLSLFRPVDREVEKLFGLLLPAPRPGPIDLLPEEEREEPAPWYLRPWGVATLGGSAILTILGVVVLTSTPIQPDRNSVWEGFGPP